MAISSPKKAGAIKANSTTVTPCRAPQKREKSRARRREYFAKIRNMPRLSHSASVGAFFDRISIFPLLSPLSVGRNLRLCTPRQYPTGIDFPLHGTQSRMTYIVNDALSGEQK